jgi:hypothetical protein
MIEYINSVLDTTSTNVKGQICWQTMLHLNDKSLLHIWFQYNLFVCLIMPQWLTALYIVGYAVLLDY